MTELEKLEKRWLELVGQPRTNDEIEETFALAKKIEQERAKEYSGLIEDLSSIGIKISSIWDLVNTKEKYPKAIPFLLKYLPHLKYERSKEGIIRALTVKEAKGQAVPLLIKEYLKTPKEKDHFRWVIGNAVFATVTLDDVASIIPIVINIENGWSREMFVFAIGKFKTDEVKNVLLKLMIDKDKEIEQAAMKVLKKWQK